MDVPSLIRDYGYGAVLFASMLEGEMVQVTAGVAARAGLLEWQLALLAGTVGVFLATQTWFLSGHYAGPRILKQRPQLQPGVERARALLDRYGTWLFVGYRFLYGLRTVIPLAIGMSGVHPAKFALIDALSWLAWFAVLSSIGFYLGETAIDGAVAASAWAAWLPLALIIAGVSWGALRWARARAQS
jgi:membrane protein DedA with SNARE-associated domain